MLNHARVEFLQQDKTMGWTTLTDNINRYPYDSLNQTTEYVHRTNHFIKKYKSMLNRMTAREFQLYLNQVIKYIE